MRDNGPVTTSAQRWGSSGLAALTGLPDGPPDFSRAEVLRHAQRVADAFATTTGVAVDAATILTGRAGLSGLRRQGRLSAGGGTRLFATRDDWCALTLARDEDLDAVAALVEADEAPSDPWRSVTCWAAAQSAQDVVARAGLLDIPVARLGEADATTPTVRLIGARRAAAPWRSLLVADLSSMWAGPLCTRLLALAGATVVKVESPTRPDGTRAGDPRFFDWMNSGKLCYSVDFDDPALKRLLTAADIVIEGSRPGTLERRDLRPTARPGQVWLRITGHGHGVARVAFGDDAAVAGGLVAVAGGGPVFCGDAMADPLTGLEAAKTVVDSLGRGGGEIIDVSMAAVGATYAALPLHAPDADVTADPPHPPPVAAQASRRGADNAAVERLLAGRCAPC